MKRYLPLFALVLIALLEATALSSGLQKGPFMWMHFFMGLFLCKFALLKLFDLSGFSKGFQMYDLVAKKVPLYGCLYPFIELALGLCYLSFSYPLATYLITILLMAVGAFGVIRALRQGLDVRCACMGTALDVPLSTVTLAEDIGMGFMAFIMLFSV